MIMECYFMVDTYMDEEKGRGMYDEYIRKVKPIVESFGGEYLLRTVTKTLCMREPAVWMPGH